MSWSRDEQVSGAGCRDARLRINRYRERLGARRNLLKSRLLPTSLGSSVPDAAVAKSNTQWQSQWRQAWRGMLLVILKRLVQVSWRKFHPMPYARQAARAISAN